MTEDGREWTKGKNGPWKVMKDTKSSARSSERGDLQLCLAIETQAEGEPDHWSLVVAREGGRGDVFQVTGKKVVPQLLQDFYAPVLAIPLYVSGSLSPGRGRVLCHMPNSVVLCIGNILIHDDCFLDGWRP